MSSTPTCPGTPTPHATINTVAQKTILATESTNKARVCINSTRETSQKILTYAVSIRAKSGINMHTIMVAADAIWIAAEATRAIVTYAEEAEIAANTANATGAHNNVVAATNTDDALKTACQAERVVVTTARLAVA